MKIRKALILFLFSFMGVERNGKFMLKKIVSIVTALVMVACSCTALAIDSGEILNLYVANVSDNGDGSFHSPFNSLNAARDFVRELKSQGKYPSGGVVVNIRGGEYRIENSFTLDSRDSGMENAPVVYRAYLNEEVGFIGGVEVDLKEFSPVTDESVKERLIPEAVKDIVCYNLRENGITDYGELNIYGQAKAYFIMDGTDLPGVPVEPAPEVFFGSETMTIARYPNDGWCMTDNIIQIGDEIEMWTDMNKALETYVPKEERNYPPLPSIFTVNETTKQRMKNWKNADDVWVYGYFKFDWSDVSLPVASLDTETGTVTTEYPCPKSMTKNRRFYFYNLLEELDMPGEYYLDRTAGIIYMIPPEKSGTLTLSLLNEPFISADGAENVTIKGLSFKGTRKHGFDIKNGNNIKVELCSISKTSEYGIYFTDCRNTRVISCHIYDCGTGGVYYEWGSGLSKYGFKEKLISNGNMVDNCHFENFARIRKTYSAAVEGGGVGMRISHNKIHGSDHMALGLVGALGLIEYNEIYDVLRTADDSGAIYGGFSKTSRGAVIRNNYFYNCASSSKVGSHGRGAVYADDLRDAVTFEQNILVNFDGEAMFANGGRNHTIQNNILINTNGILHLTASGTDPSQADKYDISRFDFLEYADNPAYAQFPNFTDLYTDNWQAPKYNVVRNNVLWECDESFRLSGLNGTTEGKVREDNSLEDGFIINEDPGFVDAQNGNYTLKADSMIYEKFPDFKAPDFMNIGMYTPHLKVRLKDCISFMINSPVAYHGFNDKLIDKDNHNITPVIIGDKTYVPIRFLGEALGAKVSYDESTNQAVINRDADSLVIDLANGKYLFNEKEMSWDAPVVIEGRTLVPVRVISEAFSKQVDWVDNCMIIVSDTGNILGEADVNLKEELKRRLMTN